MNERQQEFVARLRQQRERRGVTLDSIAERTKIKRSLLVALEQNNLSRWPEGIFRRAYIRSYADAIGLAPDRTVAEFQDLFRDETATPGGSSRDLDESNPLTLTFAGEVRAGRTVLAKRAMAVAMELAVVLLAGSAASLAAGTGFWTTSGVVALLYYPVATGAFGQTLAVRLLTRGIRLSRRRQATVAAAATDAAVPAATLSAVGSARVRRLETVEPASGATTELANGLLLVPSPVHQSAGRTEYPHH